MRYLYFSALLIAGIFFVNTGCHNHDLANGGHTHEPDASHDEGPEPFSLTVWATHTELFVEFPPLVVGMESRFAVHFTEMQNFKAVKEGQAMVCLLEGMKEIDVDTVTNPLSPGIFSMGITPKKAGTFKMVFVLNTATFTDSIFVNDVPVYASQEEAMAANPHTAEGDEVAFTKEQAWKVDFAIEKAQRQTINEVIRTSGEFQPVKGEEKIVAAKSSGIVFFKSRKLQEGRDIKAGETLFTISSKGLMQSNLEEKFQIAKARIDKTKVDFERAEKLLAQQIIGQKEYERRKMEFSIAEAEFKTLTSNYNENGQNVAAPMTGIVKNVLVSDGQFVAEGTPLLEITSNRRLILHAEVSQQYLPQLRTLQSANFKTPYQDQAHSIKDYNGKLVSYGKMLDGSSAFVPVFFELDNKGELLPGSFVELFLLTSPIENALVVPRSALMQDYSLNYVYVQADGESFEKREVKLGVDDGVDVQILSGIEEGEWVVTKGAYQIKMASMSSTIPAHGHSH